MLLLLLLLLSPLLPPRLLPPLLPPLLRSVAIHVSPTASACFLTVVLPTAATATAGLPYAQLGGFRDSDRGGAACAQWG